MTEVVRAATAFTVSMTLLAGYFAMVAAFWGGVF
jgi:hypothetical protein